MQPIVVGGGCAVMLSADGLYIFDVPRSIFDDLPGVEVDRIDGQTNHRIFYKCGMLTGGMDMTFFCKEPPSNTLTHSPLLLERDGAL